MATFLVERYVPGVELDRLLEAIARVDAETAALRRRGFDLEYLGSTFLPEDEACFCQFEASELALIAEACELGGLPYARISEVLQISREDVIRASNREKENV